MSAILHEVQHLTDDMARGFPGKEVLYQPNVRWAMESNAFSNELAQGADPPQYPRVAANLHAPSRTVGG